MNNATLKSLVLGLSLFMAVSCEKGNDGLTSLFNIISEPAGELCESGGYKIETGIDKNDNGLLDPNEVQNQEYLCNGNDGAGSITLGDAQTGFEIGSVYQASTDGFLLVQFLGVDWSGHVFDVYVYSDTNENPSTIAGSISHIPGSISIPVQKNYYWKVEISEPTEREYIATISWVSIHT